MWILKLQTRTRKGVGPGIAGGTIRIRLKVSPKSCSQITLHLVSVVKCLIIKKGNTKALEFFFSILALFKKKSIAINMKLVHSISKFYGTYNITIHIWKLRTIT